MLMTTLDHFCRHCMIKVQKTVRRIVSAFLPPTFPLIIEEEGRVFTNYIHF
jgi:hypothetical protein